jgi:hypothetical protein
MWERRLLRIVRRVQKMLGPPRRSPPYLRSHPQNPKEFR